jgi:hypothetical protein
MAGDSDGIITLVKEAASDFGQLVADHIRLARVEMTADAKSYARDIAMPSSWRPATAWPASRAGSRSPR